MTVRLLLLARGRAEVSLFHCIWQAKLVMDVPTQTIRPQRRPIRTAVSVDRTIYSCRDAVGASTESIYRRSIVLVYCVDRPPPPLVPVLSVVNQLDPDLVETCIPAGRAPNFPWPLASPLQKLANTERLRVADSACRRTQPPPPTYTSRPHV